METSCTVCGQGVTIFQRCELRHRRLVCKSCYEKAGLKKAGIPHNLVNVDDVCVLCGMDETDQPAYIEEMREGLRQESENAIARQAAAPPPVPACAKCGSTSISADKKGFGVGKAVIGATLVGPIGLTGGNIGAKKVRITCLNCGHQWMAGSK